jgi:type II secretory pathway component GspD/PulD (secretin)
VVDRLRNLIPSLDRRTPQVTVQVRILSVNRANIEQLGVHYEIKEPGGTQINRFAPGLADPDGDGVLDVIEPESEVVELTGDGIAALGNAVDRVSDPGLSVLASLVLNSHTLITWIDAVEELRLAELQADPVVTVLDHRTARVHVGERTPIRVVDPGSSGAQGPQAQVRIEQTGVILELTPHVVGTDQVLLALHAERSDIGNVTPDGSGFTFTTQETDTEILLNDGETAVISGLTTTDLRETLRGIPVLMHLPVIGVLFRKTELEQSKDDLLIMVTPYIDRSGGV